MPAIDTSALANEFSSFAQKFQPYILAVHTQCGDLTVEITSDKLPEAVFFLKNECTPRFNVMMDLCGVDYSKFSVVTRERFAVIYNLYSIPAGKRIFLKVWASESEPKVPSIHKLFAAANWFEREVWDMFGIVFTGHPNLHRILCHNEFQGHPLRKDYPSDGYQQLKIPSPSQRL